MRKTILSVSALLLASVGVAQNPIISTAFTPDPAPYVHGDTLYLFVDHDEDDAQYFKMQDWMLYSTTDMVNWTYRGTPMSTATFKWCKQGDNAWASQAIERDGKWYWYVACEDTTNHLHGVGVAVADSPEGPYKDAIGKPLVPGDWGFIDPSVFIDTDGQAYLFWGNNGLWYAKLNRDMVSIDGDIIKVEIDDEKAFGPKVMKRDYQLNKQVLKSGFEEAPWVYKRGNTYYLEYAAGGVPEHWAYSTATNIAGPWTYRGRIMDEAEKSFTIHGGAVEFKGRNFMFYHDGRNINGGGFRRATCVEEFKYNADGTIPKIPFTKHGVRKPIHALNPFQRVEAETMAEGYALKTDRRDGNEHYLTRVFNGSWQKLRSVDFKEGGSMVQFRVRGLEGGSIEMLVDGKAIAKVEVQPGTQWQTVQAGLSAVSGVHDLHILYRGGDKELMEVDWWKIVK